MRRDREGVVLRGNWGMAARTGILVLGAAAVLTAAIGLEWVSVGLLALLVSAVGYLVVDVRQTVRATSARQRADAKKLMTAVTRLHGETASDASVRMTERRILDTVEAERLRSLDRHRDVLSLLSGLQERDEETRARLLKQVHDAAARTARGLKESRVAIGRDIESLLALRNVLEPRALMPSTGGFALEPRALAHLVGLVSAARPRLVLELGSGTSTVWLGYLLQTWGGRAVSVEHDEKYHTLTASELTRHGLADVVDLRHAALEPLGIGDRPDALWYSQEGFVDVTGVNLLLIDGPPEATGHEARWPAMPILAPRLAPGALVLLDDADRVGEQNIVAAWLDSFPELELLDDTTSRLAVLRMRAART